MAAKKILHYEILEKLGEGGMGVVYLAEDTKLDRKVAIKFLPSDIARNSDERMRFEIEAKAAAALNHPNIATIYSIEEVNDELFMVMEFIEGQDLKDCINNTILAIDTATNYAIQIAEGLLAAHEKGIVHRDIKSANIMITRTGKVKVMDFGLAKFGANLHLTKEHSTLGTTPYMSPEQIRGEEVDFRSDIWSFGVVLYEMFAGQLPFKGGYEQAVIYAILNETYVDISESIPHMPEYIHKIIDKSLQKDINDRYTSFSDILSDLNNRPSESPKIVDDDSVKSIVVLPFKNMSPDPDNEYFSDGLTEEIISDLSQVESIRVISRTSAMQLKVSAKDIKTIGQDLNVQFVLEGSVRKAGNNLRITAQLIDVAKETHLWSEKYNGTLDDIFDIQEKVSRSIVDAMRLKLTTAEQKKIQDHPIGNAKAYDFYFQARQEILKMTQTGLNKALELIERSQKIVGENIQLLSAKGYTHWMFYNSGIEPDEKHLDETERYAERILQIEPHSSHGYRLTGLAQIHRQKPKEGIVNFIKALDIDRNDPDALCFLTMLLVFTGKTIQAHKYGNRLIEIDPLSALNYISLAQVPYYEGNFSEAEQITKKALELDPENTTYNVWYLLVISTIWRKEKVREFYDKVINECNNDFFAELALFTLNALYGDYKSARSALTDKSITAARNDIQYSVFIADGYAMLNQNKEAMSWLENAKSRGFINYPFLAYHDPFLRNLDDDKEFQQYLVKVKQEWETYEGS